MADVQVALPVPAPTPPTNTTLANDEEPFQVATTSAATAVPAHPVVEATIEDNTPTPQPNDVDDVVEGRESSQAPSTEVETPSAPTTVQDVEVVNTPEVQEPQNVVPTEENGEAAASSSSISPPPLPTEGTGEDTAPGQ
jgi:hypothetical protein